jgi:hypothetical protein
MTQHVTEPWFIARADDHPKKPLVIASESNTEAIATVWAYMMPTQANANRIVACVNALAGMNPSAVGELVAAVRLILPTGDRLMDELSHTDVAHYEAHVGLHAALAKLETS